MVYCLFSVCIMLGQVEPTIERPPNIILIMVDDLGREVLQSYGGRSYQTPYLNQMAEKGAQFEHAYAYPLCTPTRVSLMTGKYNFRNWKAFGVLDPNEQTFGHLFQDQGYRTCLVGKWQLTSYDPIDYPQASLRRNTGMKIENAGFDEYCAWHVGHTEDKGPRYADPLINENGRFLDNSNGKYGPDIFSDYLVDFIDRNKDEPFFIYYPMVLTHSPFKPTPDSDSWQDRTNRHAENNACFSDMVAYTDKVIGKVLKSLEENELQENTLLLFYSDNGTKATLTSTADGRIVKGGKGLSIDDGTRVPLLAYWKGKIKPGSKLETMVSPPDFIPTFFEAIQRELPSDFLTDGQSFLPDLFGQDSNRKDWVLIDHNPRPGWDKENFIPTKFVKGKTYKYYGDGRFYKVTDDVLEENNLVRLTKKEAELKQRYSHIMDSLSRYRSFGKLMANHPEFNKIVPPTTRIEIIAQGFEWSEGPVWVEEQQAVYFSDVPRNVIYKWSAVDGLHLFLKPSGYTGSKPRKGGKGANGLAVDAQGKLVLCQQGDRQIGRMLSSFDRPLPVYEALVTHHQGEKLNSPNDLCIDSKGNIYFTDPPFGMDEDLPNAKELSFNGVYRYNTDGTLDLLAADLPAPNGIGLSLDEKTLYVSNSNPARWIAYELNSQGEITKEKWVFHAQKLKEASVSKMVPDGMAIDDQGNIFGAGPDGILVISPRGEHLGTIETKKRTSNCVFNKDKTILYVTCDDYLLRIVLGYKKGVVH